MRLLVCCCFLGMHGLLHNVVPESFLIAEWQMIRPVYRWDSCMKRTLLVLSLLAAVVRKDCILQGTSSLACAIAASVVLALAPPDASGDPPPCDPSPCGGIIPSTCDYGTRPHPTFTVNMC